MVFASRRTAILEDSRIPLILEDDAYRPVGESDALPGDLVLYRDRATSTLLHVALITHRDEELGVLFALSKWNSTSGEDFHHVRHHCWTDPWFDVELQFWTDR